MQPILLDLPMPIITPRLVIRPPQVGDGAVLNEAIVESFATLSQWMDEVQEKPTLEASEAQVRMAAANWLLKKKEPPWLQLLIFNQSNQQLIGATTFHHMVWEVPCIEISYWVRTSRERLGYITEATNALTQYAFKQLKVKRIAITCDANNIRSQRIPERLGYSLEGILKYNRISPKTHEVGDTLVYARYDMRQLPDLRCSW